MNWTKVRRLVPFLGRRRILLALFIIFWGISALIYWYGHKSHHDFYDRNKMTTRHILWWNAMPPNYEARRVCTPYVCEFSNNRKNLANSKAILFYGSSINVNDFPLPRQPHQHWSLFHEESPRNAPFLMSNVVLRHFNTTSTFSRYSDFPITTHHLPSSHDLTAQTYVVPNRDNSFLAPVVFLQSNCDTLTRREDYVRELMRFIRIDSYGSCLHNRDLPKRAQKDFLNNLYSPVLLSHLRYYSFVIAIENGVCHDYITEKFWRPLIVGSIPIYFGSPTIRDWAPNNKSAIYIEDYESPKALADYLHKLLQNNTEYNSYFDHKFNQMEPIANKRLRNDLLLRSHDKNLLGAFECQVCREINKEQEKKVKQANINHYNCPLPPPLPPMYIREHQMSKTNWESILRVGQCQAQVLDTLLTRNIPYTKKTFDLFLQQLIDEGNYLNDNWKCTDL